MGNGISETIATDGAEHCPIPVEQLASKDCLVCGRAYRYSHNARRHERNTHSYDRYTNKIETGPLAASYHTNSYKMDIPSTQYHHRDSNIFSKHNSQLVEDSSTPKHFHSDDGSQILKTLLTTREDDDEDDDEDVSESEMHHSRSESPETEVSEPDLPSYDMKKTASAPRTYEDDSSEDDEMEHSRSINMRYDIDIDISSQSDINRIIGIEEDDDVKEEIFEETTEMMDASPEFMDDGGPPIANNVEVENTYSEVERTVELQNDDQLDSEEEEEESQDEDDDMRVSLVPIVEIDENPHEVISRNMSRSFNESSNVSLDNVKITYAQKWFIEKYRNLIEQINTMKCKCCDKDFPHRKAIIQHLKKSTRIPKHTCYSCVLTFSHIGALLSHMRFNCCNDTWKLIYKEDGIPESMIIEDDASSDIHDTNENETVKPQYKDALSAKSYICRLCPAKFQLKQFILKHIYDAHESAVINFSPLTCYNCKHKFLHDRMYKKHLRNGECTILIECELCFDTFLNIQAFNEHAVTEHTNYNNQEVDNDMQTIDEKCYNCPICAKSFLDYHNMVQHMRASHNEMRPHLCQHCDRKFEHFEELTNHLYAEHSERIANGDDDEMAKQEIAYNYSCTDCSAIFDTVDGWTEHQINVHHHIAHKCDQCNKKFWQESELEEHKRTHIRVNPFKCKQCPSSFNSPTKLTEHMTQHHRLSSLSDRSFESQFYCDICIRSFKSRQAFSNHMRIHAKVPTTNRKSGEIKRQPPNVPHPNKNVTKVNSSKLNHRLSQAPYSCDICGKGFLHKKNIWKHKKMLHPDVINKTQDVVENNVVKNVSTEEEDFTNEDSQNCLPTPQFDSFVTAVYDQQENSGSEGALNYQCDLCDKRFAVKSSIWKHKRVKHGVTNPMQDLPETLKPEVKQEVSTNSTGIYCAICKMSFTDRRAYHRHRKLGHRVNNVHKCTVCGIVLNSSLELYEHLQSGHSREPMKASPSQVRPQKKQILQSMKVHKPSDEEILLKEKHMHRDLKYSCEGCGKSFAELHILQNHVCLQRLPMSETYNCEICNKSYTSISALKSHRGWHLRSPDGRAAFSNSGLWMPQNKVTNKVSKHEVVDSPNSPNPTAVPKEISPLQLKRKLPPDVQVTLLKRKKTPEVPSTVPVSSSPKMEFSGHQAAHRDGHYPELNDKVVIKKPVQSRQIEAPKPKNVFCPICSRSFTRKSSLLVHMRKHVTGSLSERADESDDEREDVIANMQVDVYKCDVCDMKLNSLSALNHHKMKYHGVVANKMPAKGQVMHRFQEAGGDIRTVEDGAMKEYRCSLCGGEWDTEEEVLKHPHHHCSICGVYFAQVANLLSHVKTLHPSIVDQMFFPCNKCDKTYMNKKSLNRHMDTCH